MLAAGSQWVGFHFNRCVFVWLRAALLASSALTAVAVPAAAQDATWLATPATNNFNTDANWSSGVTPTGTAAFGPSTQTNLTVSSANVEFVAI